MKNQTQENTYKEHVNDIFESQKKAFKKYGQPSLGTRKIALGKLLDNILMYKNEIIQAISRDFGHRSYHESLMGEIFCCVNAIKHTRNNLNKWMKPQKRSVPWYLQPGEAKIYYQPLGVVGIVAPWNYPFQLCIGPLIPAIAAGNRVMLKPSGQTPETANIIDKIISKIFDPNEVSTIKGPEANDFFIHLPFDHLLYTGSTRVGKIVMKAAANNLTPVTLELGGKSPAIIAEDYPINKAASSIVAGKLFNAGQSCIAPNHVLVPKDKIIEFINQVKKQANKFYPTIIDNADYTSIISEKRYNQILDMIDDAKVKGAKVEYTHQQEKSNREIKKIIPALILNVNDSMKIMQEEIFGPVLPVIPYDEIYDAIEYVEKHPKPLAIYCFSNDTDITDTVIRTTTSGGGCVNDTLIHFIQDDLPFGGVGPSGMGRYHGFFGFQTFSNIKGIFHQSRFNMISSFQPPYGKLFNRMSNFLIGK